MPLKKRKAAQAAFLLFLTSTSTLYKKREQVCGRRVAAFRSNPPSASALLHGNELVSSRFPPVLSHLRQKALAMY